MHEWPDQLPAQFKRLDQIPGIKIDLRYASTDNFMNKNIYGPGVHAYLHEKAFEMLKAAAQQLQKRNPGYQLLIFDALRPRRAQRELFAFVKGTAFESYVANPDLGSVHNFGFAVDLSIIDGQGNELDMGTPFDDFHELSQPKLESHFLGTGQLTTAAQANRQLLKSVMEDQGFKQLPYEWWHFDAIPKEIARSQYLIIE